MMIPRTALLIIAIFLTLGAPSFAFTSGAGYYGATDLSGNVWKRSVNIGNSYGRSFTGTHGTGALTITGHLI